jgi:glyceraldehyde 3-phosphate dehydrogenase
VNPHNYKPEQDIVFNASWTTNCIASLAKVLIFLLDNKRIIRDRGESDEHGACGDSHLEGDGWSEFGSQELADWQSRAARRNIIPSSTGAAKAVALVIPDLKGKFTGMPFRVPVLNVNVIDLTVELKKEAKFEEICHYIRFASQNELNVNSYLLKSIVGYCEEDLVSYDFIQNPLTCIIDKKAINFSIHKHCSKWNFCKTDCMV